MAEKAKVFKLASHIEYADESVVSKTLVNKKVGTLTLFAFDAGQGLSEHTAPYDAVVEILDGSAEITVGGETFTARTGELSASEGIDQGVAFLPVDTIDALLEFGVDGRHFLGKMVHRATEGNILFRHF